MEFIGGILDRKLRRLSVELWGGESESQSDETCQMQTGNGSIHAVVMAGTSGDDKSPLFLGDE